MSKHCYKCSFISVCVLRIVGYLLWGDALLDKFNTVLQTQNDYLHKVVY